MTREGAARQTPGATARDEGKHFHTEEETFLFLPSLSCGGLQKMPEKFAPA